MPTDFLKVLKIKINETRRLFCIYSSSYKSSLTRRDSGVANLVQTDSL
ncbi:hypothetical protein KCTC52924_02997 [Arenibacter antarcticus]